MSFYTKNISTEVLGVGQLSQAWQEKNVVTNAMSKCNISCPTPDDISEARNMADRFICLHILWEIGNSLIFCHLPLRLSP